MTKFNNSVRFALIVDILCMIVIAIMIYEWFTAEPLIEVRVSDLTGECIEIVDENGKVPCPEVLPERYIQVIVYGGEK